MQKIIKDNVSRKNVVGKSCGGHLPNAIFHVGITECRIVATKTRISTVPALLYLVRLFQIVHLFLGHIGATHDMLVNTSTILVVQRSELHLSRSVKWYGSRIVTNTLTSAELPFCLCRSTKY